MAKKEFRDIAKETIGEIKTRVWPQTKKELEKAISNARVIIDKGEKYFKEVSEKGIDNTKKLSLTLKKEKFYYDLGKTAAQTPKTQWDKNKKITGLIKAIKKIDKAIKDI